MADKKININIITKVTTDDSASIKAHKVTMIHELHMRLTRSWHQADLIGDEECKIAIAKSLKPINKLLSCLVG